MAIAEVGSGSQRATKSAGNVDSTTLAYPGNVTSGSLLIVAGAAWNTSAPTIAVTDTLGTSYTVLERNGLPWAGGGTRLLIAYGIAPSGGANTVTVDPTGTGNYITFSIDEFSGPHATPLDVDGGATAGGPTTTPSDDLTTLTADALLIGVMTRGGEGAATITPGTGYTQIGEYEGVDIVAHSAVFRIVTTAQAYTVDWTMSTSLPWYAQTAAFKPSTGGGAQPWLYRPHTHTLGSGFGRATQ